MIKYRLSIMFMILVLSVVSWKLTRTSKDIVAVDTSWNFEHCTSHSTPECGRLE